MLHRIRTRLLIFWGFGDEAVTNPRLADEGKNPFQLDSHDPKIPLQDYIYTEGRYRMLKQSDPEAAKLLLDLAQQSADHRWQQYKKLAANNV